VISVAAADDPPAHGRLQSERAARLLDLLGLTEDELCTLLAVDPLTLLSGQLDHRPELAILQDLLADAQERAGAPVLRRWVRASGPSGRPIDALIRRDFTAFEDALAELADRGFVLRGGGGGWGGGGHA
jgi:nucleotide-binding universal stress UspA family protein